MKNVAYIASTVFRNRSIVRHYFLFSFIFNVIPIILFSVIVFYGSGRILTNQINIATARTQKQMAMNIDSNIQNIVHSADLLRNNQLLKELLDEKHLGSIDNAARINTILKKMIIESKFPLQIILIDGEGGVYENSDFYTEERQATITETIKDANWYSTLGKLRGGMFWIGKLYNLDFESDTDFLYYMGCNIFNENAYCGTFLFGIHDYFFSKQMNNLKPSPNSRVYLVDEYGKILIASEDSYLKNDQGSNPNSIMVTTEPLIYFGFVVRTEIPKREILSRLYFIRNVTITMIILTSILLYLSLNIIRRTIVLPISRLSKTIRKSKNTEQIFSYDGNIEELNILVNGLNTMITTIKEDTLEKRDLEFKFLQSQIKPHFLYNTLNCIKWMAELKNEKNIVRAITSLVKVIDYSINKKGPFIPLGEELKFVRDYIHIMNLRFANSITFRAPIDSHLTELPILKLSLQPIVENSILHSFSLSGENNYIDITAHISEDNLIVNVVDNGKGISPEKVKLIMAEIESETKKDEESHDRIGLNNIHSRLKLEFGAEYGVNIQSDPKAGTRVSLRFPILEDRTIKV